MRDRILITGGQGFLGRHLAAHWLLADPQATVVSVGRSAPCPGRFARRLQWGREEVEAPLPRWMAEALDSPRHSYEGLNVCDRLAMTELIGRLQPSHIVHLAGELRDEALEQMLATNVLGVEALMEAIRGAHVRPERVVMGSTGGIYGIPQRLPIQEDSPCRPLDLYTSTKLSAEHVARNISSRHGIPLVWARIFNPVGPGQDERHLTSTLARQVAAIAEGRRAPRIEVGPLTTTRDFIDGRDVAAALHCLATRGEAGRAYNVGSGVETPIADTLRLCLDAARLGPDVKIERRPARPSDVPRHVADMSRLGALGFEARFSFEESIAELVRYYREDVATASPVERGPSAATTRLAVTIPRQDSYDVEVEAGLLSQLPARLRTRFPRARFAVLSDARVHSLYASSLVSALSDAGEDPIDVVLPEGEVSKSPRAHLDVIAALREGGFDRRSVLINVGGGMISDLGGFVAATYMRGVDYVNVPTTLLAQHDASIGGKVAVNAPWAKNFIGAFHHPRAVYIDPEVLQTLDDRDIGAGIAEAVKVGMCGDRDLLYLLEASVNAIRARRDPHILGEIVARSARRKLELLDPDPYEIDLRRVLNLGHSFGHALETELHYTDLRHGEAVAWGIAVATAVAFNRGRCDRETHDRILALLAAYDLPRPIERQHLAGALGHLGGVRLVRGGCLNEVLPTTFGWVDITADVGDDEFLAALDAFTDAPGIPLEAG